MSITVQDIARRARVAPSTVSLVLNKKPNVRPITRQVVLRACKELQYVPRMSGNPTASSSNNELKTAVIIYANRTVWHGAAVQITVEILQGIRSWARSNNIHLMINAGFDTAEDDLIFREMLSDTRQVDGAILIGVDGQDGYRESLLASGTPLVVINRSYPDEPTSTINLDNEGGTYAATEHLIEQGYERIVYVTRVSRYSYDQERLAGYKNAMKQAGHQVSSEEILEVTDTSPTAAHESYRIMSEYLDRIKKPVSVVSSDDYLCVGIIKALQAKGYRVPEDAGVVGFNNIDELELPDGVGGISTISFDKYELGRLSLETLARLVQSPRSVRQINMVARTELITRESSNRPSL